MINLSRWLQEGLQANVISRLGLAEERIKCIGRWGGVFNFGELPSFPELSHHITR